MEDTHAVQEEVVNAQHLVRLSIQCTEAYFSKRLGSRSKKSLVSASDCLGEVLINVLTPLLRALEERLHVIVATVTTHVSVNTV